MKNILLLFLFTCLPLYSNSQQTYIKTDSFSFCGKKFKVPKNCETNDSTDCCNFYGTIMSIGCTKNNSLLTWHQLPNLQMTKTFYNGFIQEELNHSNSKTLAQPYSDIYILGTSATESFIIKWGDEYFTLFTYGEVNNKAVFISYRSKGDLFKDAKAKSLFDGIISWK